MEAGLVASCHDCSDGGLGVALAETAFAGGLGLTVDLSGVPCEGLQRNDELLFSESQSRFVVTVCPTAKAAFERILKGNVRAEVGCVNAEGTLRIKGLKGNLIMDEDIHELKAVWQKPLNF
jgi:phosphoribosylformylglycinamidine synthase